MGNIRLMRRFYWLLRGREGGELWPLPRLHSSNQYIDDRLRPTSSTRLSLHTNSSFPWWIHPSSRGALSLEQPGRFQQHLPQTAALPGWVTEPVTREEMAEIIYRCRRKAMFVLAVTVDYCGRLRGQPLLYVKPQTNKLVESLHHELKVTQSAGKTSQFQLSHDLRSQISKYPIWFYMLRCPSHFLSETNVFILNLRGIYYLRPSCMTH